MKNLNLWEISFFTVHEHLQSATERGLKGQDFAEFAYDLYTDALYTVLTNDTDQITFDELSVLLDSHRTMEVQLASPDEVVIEPSRIPFGFRQQNEQHFSQDTTLPSREEVYMPQEALGDGNLYATHPFIPPSAAIGSIFARTIAYNKHALTIFGPGDAFREIAHRNYLLGLEVLREGDHTPSEAALFHKCLTAMSSAALSPTPRQFVPLSDTLVAPFNGGRYNTTVSSKNP